MKRFAIPAIADPRTLAAIEETFASGIWRTDSGASVFRSTGFEASITQPIPANSIISEQLENEHLPLAASEPDSLLAPGMWQGDKLRYTTHFNIGSCCVIGDLEVRSFPVSHDAVAPSGYLLKADGNCVCIVIDSGKVTPTMLKMMAKADLLIIESNHDRQRLLNGPYPYAVKQRILSAKGHLSNDQAAEAILHTWPPHGVRWVWLSHLSQVNNTPELAIDAIRNHIEFAKANPAQVHVTTLPPGMGSIWDSSQLWRTPSLWET